MCNSFLQSRIDALRAGIVDSGNEDDEDLLIAFDRLLSAIWRSAAIDAREDESGLRESIELLRRAPDRLPTADSKPLVDACESIEIALDFRRAEREKAL